MLTLIQGVVKRSTNLYSAIKVRIFFPDVCHLRIIVSVIEICTISQPKESFPAILLSIYLMTRLCISVSVFLHEIAATAIPLLHYIR